MKIERQGDTVIASEGYVSVSVDAANLPASRGEARAYLRRLFNEARSRMLDEATEPILDVDLDDGPWTRAAIKGLPGWATWTPAEARENVNEMIDGISSLAEAKTVLNAVLPRMAQVIALLLRVVYDGWDE
jgi:hypothetical protein